MPLLLKILLFVIVVTVINVPFGSYRNITKKFSVAWFLSIHLPIPLIIVMRRSLFHEPIELLSLSISPLWIIPFSISAAVFGQMIGKKFKWFGIYDPDAITVKTKTSAEAESAFE